MIAYQVFGDAATGDGTHHLTLPRWSVAYFLTTTITITTTTAISIST